READRHVRPPLGMDERAARLSGLHHVRHRRQRLPLHLDQIDRVLRARAALRHDHGDDLADITRAIAAERPLGRLADVEPDRRGEIFRAHQVLNSSPARDYIPRVGPGPGGARALGSTGGLGYSPCQPSPSRRRRPMATRWIVLVALVLAAIATTAGPAQSQALIKIGVIEPLSGPVAASGNYVRMGAEIARDWLNPRGGGNGRKSDLRTEDNKSDPKEAASAAEKLIVRDRVPAI